MKRFLIILLSFVTLNSFGQNWDVLQYGKESNKCTSSIIVKCDYNNQPTTFTVSSYVWNDYKFGTTMFKTGGAFLFTGGLLSIVGGVVYGTGVHSNNLTSIKAGGIMLGTGGTIFGIGIPLMCFGDNIKRACNREVKLYNELK